MLTLQDLQYFAQGLWTKIKDTFLTKDAVIDGVLVGQEWVMLQSVIGNTPIALPSTDTFDEIYIEMYSANGIITHQKSIRRDSILFESNNTTHREILLDGIHDFQTYVKYDIATHSIIPMCYEGDDLTASSVDITTNIYLKGNQIANGNVGASKISFNNTTTDLNAPNVQGAIEELNENMKNVPTVFDYVQANGYQGTEQEFVDSLINMETEIITNEEVDDIINSLN